MAETAGKAAGDHIAQDGRPLADLAPEGRRDVHVHDGQVYLCGARSASSGIAVFPAADICPETGARDMEPAEFGPRATLYSFSSVHVSATRATPYTLGYIDFPGGLRVLAHLRAAPDSLKCDMPVRLASDGSAWWAEPEGAAA